AITGEGGTEHRTPAGGVLCLLDRLQVTPLCVGPSGAHPRGEFVGDRLGLPILARGEHEGVRFGAAALLLAHVGLSSSSGSRTLGARATGGGPVLHRTGLVPPGAGRTYRWPASSGHRPSVKDR